METGDVDSPVVDEDDDIVELFDISMGFELDFGKYECGAQYELELDEPVDRRLQDAEEEDEEAECDDVLSLDG
jgi:hypothetical protein